MMYLNYDKLAKYLVKKSGCTWDQACDYLEYEDEFLDTKGLIIWDADPETYTEDDNVSAEDLPVIEGEELIAYVSEHSGIDIELVEDLYLLEIEYTDQMGNSVLCI